MLQLARAEGVWGEGRPKKRGERNLAFFFFFQTPLTPCARCLSRQWPFQFPEVVCRVSPQPIDTGNKPMGPSSGQPKDRANSARGCWASISICPLFHRPSHRARLKSTSAYFTRPYQKQVHENTRSKRCICIFSAPLPPTSLKSPTQPGSKRQLQSRGAQMGIIIIGPDLTRH